MAVTQGLTHIAVSVPTGTLTAAWRSDFDDLYGKVFGWTEIDNGDRPGRFTVAIGRGCYLNVREREQPMICTEYEHFGMLVESGDDVERLWARLDTAFDDIELGDVDRRQDGTCTFRFHHLLPMTMEIQYFPPGASDVSPRPWRRDVGLVAEPNDDPRSIT